MRKRGASAAAERYPALSREHGKILKALREAHGLSMREFGKIVGLSAATISLMEQGKRGLSMKTFLEIRREFPHFKLELLLHNVDWPDAEKRGR